MLLVSKHIFGVLSWSSQDPGISMVLNEHPFSTGASREVLERNATFTHKYDFL